MNRLLPKMVNKAPLIFILLSLLILPLTGYCRPLSIEKDMILGNLRPGDPFEKMLSLYGDSFRVTAPDYPGKYELGGMMNKLLPAKCAYKDIDIIYSYRGTR